MRKIICTTIIICTSLFVNAQDFTKKDFLNTDWFTENIDSLFFKSDTISLIQYNNPSPDWSQFEYTECVFKHFNHFEYLDFGFETFNNFNYREHQNDGGVTLPSKEYSWRFKKKEKTIKIFKNDILFIELKPILKKQIEIKSSYSHHTDLLATFEIVCVKIK